MVETAILLPESEVENVAQRHGEVSIEAVRKTYSEVELEHLQRETLAGEDEVVVLAALDPVERQRVEEVAESEGMQPAEWLAEETLRVAREGPAIGHVSLERQVEDVIMRRS